jgi:hypothetical protein
VPALESGEYVVKEALNALLIHRQNAPNYSRNALFGHWFKGAKKNAMAVWN